MEEIKKLVKSAAKITVLTGAGMSTESGIPDFRSPGGIWSRYKTVTLQEFIEDEEKRRYYWRYKSDTIPSMLKAKPNEAHRALGRLDQDGRLFYLITQNIDGLDERGGVAKERIINIHGTNLEAVCLTCGRIFEISGILKEMEPCDYNPLCSDCGGLVKPNTVSFGQQLKAEHLDLSHKAAMECDLFLALGSSLVVFPAASFVEVAYRAGKPVIIINRDATPYDSLAAFKLTDSLAEVLPKLI